MDLASRELWVEYSKAKDEMFAYTDIKQAPWYVVDADDKKRAPLELHSPPARLIPYEDLTPAELPKLKPRPPMADTVSKEMGYVRPPISDQTFVTDHYGKV